MHLSFLKKKKKWNGIVAMALPNSIPLFTIPKVFFTPYFGNVIATIAKNLYPLFRQCHCRKLFFFLPFSAMALPQLPIFFFHHLVFLARTHTSNTHPGSRYGQKELQQYHCRKSKISLSYFLSFSLQLLLNFGNGIAAIHSIFSDC